jgi:hypothetical protein
MRPAHGFAGKSLKSLPDRSSAGGSGASGRAGVMARIVQKFGGTSVADLDRIRNAALRVKRECDRGNEVAVVVSAMAETTTIT